MLLSDMLEVAIGLTFLFLLLSLMLTALQELIEQFWKKRANALLQGISEMLADPANESAGADAVRAIYQHPVVTSLYRGAFDPARTKDLPSYIPARNFALALISQTLDGKLAPAPAAPGTSVPSGFSATERLRLAAERIDNTLIRNAMLQAVALGQGDIERTQKHLEDWYDSTMDRVSGWYKRHTQKLVFVIGLTVAVVLNVNALTVMDTLSENGALRRALADSAAAYLEETEGQAGPAAAGEPAQNVRDYRTRLTEISRLGLPIGWSPEAREALRSPMRTETQPWVFADIPIPKAPEVYAGVLQIALGYVLTALACTLGAPFWFDLLNRLMVVRATVKPHEKSPEEASQDHQQPGGGSVVNLTVQDPAAPAAPRQTLPSEAEPATEPLDPLERPRED